MVNNENISPEFSLKIEQSLKEHPFFKDLDSSYLRPLIACAKNVKFSPGEIIYRENDPADQFLLITHGKVAIEIFVPGRGSLTIQTVGQGEVLGWSWLFPPYRRRFDARAIELTRGIVLAGQCLRDMIEQDYQLGYQLLKRFSQVVVDRLKATSIKLLDIYGQHP